MSGKWYSAMSTGILEIDCQHQNLDSVLSLALTSPGKQSCEMLHTFAKALSDHFRFEEEYTLPSGSPFVDAEHKAEHRQLEKTVLEILPKVDGCSEMLDIVSMEFSRTLMSHAVNFDIPASKY